MTELQVGVHGLRTFRVSDDGNLLPVTAVDDSWRGGVCIAHCRRSATHRAPVERCRCGIYSFRSLSVLTAQYEPAAFLVAVVALEGQTLAGSKGWRSQAARVVSLWVAPGALPNALLSALSANLEGVPIYLDVAEMLANFPELSVGPAPGQPASTYLPGAVQGVATAPPVATTRQVHAAHAVSRPFPIRPRQVRPALVVIFFVAVVAGTVLFAIGEAQPVTGATGTGLLDQMWKAIGRFGIFLAAHNLMLLAPLLFLGLSMAARRSIGKGADVVGKVAWSLTSVVVAGVLGALLTGNTVQFNLLAAWMLFVIGGRWTGLFLFSVGHSDGTVGLLARTTLRSAAALRRTVFPSKRATGVHYQPRPDHPSSMYPLMVPVHFQ